MKIADALGYYRAHSTKASDLARQLAFAGFGIVWVLRGTGVGLAQIPPPARSAVLWFAAGLAADLAQYTLATACWGIFHRYKEPTVRDDEDFRAPEWINGPALLAFWTKLGLVATGYMRLLIWLWP